MIFLALHLFLFFRWNRMGKNLLCLIVNCCTDYTLLLSLKVINTHKIKWIRKKNIIKCFRQYWVIRIIFDSIQIWRFTNEQNLLYRLYVSMCYTRNYAYKITWNCSHVNFVYKMLLYKQHGVRLQSKRKIWPFARSIQWQNLIFICKASKERRDHVNNNESYNDDNILVNFLISDFVYVIVISCNQQQHHQQQCRAVYRTHLLWGCVRFSFTSLLSFFLTIQLAALYYTSGHKLFHSVCVRLVVLASIFASNLQENEHWVPHTLL